MKWVGSYGGSLVVMATRSVAGWTGYLELGDVHRGISHADAAATVEGYTGIIEISGKDAAFKVLVIGDEPLNATYLPAFQSIVQWQFSPSEDEILQMVAAEFASAQWEQGGEFEIDGEQLIFDCSAIGAEVEPEESLPFTLASGIFRVDTAVMSDGVSGAVVHRLFAVSDVATTHGLARQLYFVVLLLLSLVAGLSGSGLVLASPVGGGEGVGEGASGVEDYRQETADFGDCESSQLAWAFGSVAAVTARKAWASMAMVMCRYQPSQLRTW